MNSRSRYPRGKPERFALLLGLVAIWLAVAALACSPAIAATGAARVLVVFVFGPQANHGSSPPSNEYVFDEIAAHHELSLGLLSASQGAYLAPQAALDISQGTRVSGSLYEPRQAPDLLARRVGSAGQESDWGAVLARAHSAPQTIEPGLLASSVPGGAGYAGVIGRSHLDAVIAANQKGRIASLSIGAPGTIAARAQTLLRRRRLVVADLPPGVLGARALGRLLQKRAADELVIAIQARPDPVGNQLLPVGMSGAQPARGLTSNTTTLPGIVAGIDIAPTALEHLAIGVPAEMRGQSIEVSGSRSLSGLQELQRRLGVLGPRLAPSLAGLLLACFLLIGVLGGVEGRSRGRRRGLRVGALAFMWLPVSVLLGPILDPAQASVEILIVVGASLLLAGLTDHLLPWPRGPILPAFVGIPVLAIDAGLGTHLLVLSILGPNPIGGARFFGIGNELKSGLTCLLLIGLAAAFGSRPRSRRLAVTVAVAGLLLGVIIGSARLGAGVGGVIIVAAGFATATVLMLPGRPSWRAIAVAIASPMLALVGLAILDLATAGGRGHLTHDVLDADSRQNLVDIVVRRTTLAFQALQRGLMPLAVLASLGAIWFAFRNRWIYSPVPYPMWRAALLGGLVAGIVGALAEDSGPLLFVVAVLTLAAATAYVQGEPRLPDATQGGDRLSYRRHRRGLQARSNQPATGLRNFSPIGVSESATPWSRGSPQSRCF